MMIQKDKKGLFRNNKIVLNRARQIVLSNLSNKNYISAAKSNLNKD